MILYLSESLESHTDKIIAWLKSVLNHALDSTDKKNHSIDRIFFFNMQKTPTFRIHNENSKKTSTLKDNKNNIEIILASKESELRGWKNQSTNFRLCIYLENKIPTIHEELSIPFGYQSWPAEEELEFWLQQIISYQKSLQKYDSFASMSHKKYELEPHFILWDSPDTTLFVLLKQIAALYPLRLSWLKHYDEISETFPALGMESVLLLNLDDHNLDPKRFYKQLQSLSPSFVPPVIGIKRTDSSIIELLRGPIRHFIRYVLSPIEWVSLYSEMRYKMKKAELIKQLHELIQPEELNRFQLSMRTACSRLETLFPPNKVNHKATHKGQTEKNPEKQSLMLLSVLQKIKENELRFSSLRWIANERTGKRDDIASLGMG